MYKIIGADGQHYGPVNADQLRQWIKEGRANARTLIQAEGATEWTPLSACAEFVNDLKLQTPPPFSTGPLPYSPNPPVNPVIAAKASSKIAAGICGILLGSLGIHKFILGYTSAGLIMLLVTLLSCGLFAWVMWIIGLIEGIVYLSKGDEDFVRTYVDGRREWF